MTERTPEELGYAESLSELEAILRELEGSAVDVDRLTEHVTRARALIQRCRDRVGEARLQIQHVVADPADGGT